jgi:predicted nucleic-acid-binding Zn-ribbon protein
MKEPAGVIVNNQSLKCTFCGNTLFHEIQTRLNQRYMSLFDMEIFSKAGKGYVCANCGLKQEFYDPKKIGKGFYGWGVWIWVILIVGFIILSIAVGE